jgi:hypothetical protein
MLTLVTGFSTAFFVIGLLAWAAAAPLCADEKATTKAADAFFAGAVTELTSDTIVVGRMVRGKAESRSFQLTPQTKTEGKLAVKVRVTVRYITDDEGDTATLIVVRGAVKQPKPKKK